MTEVDIIKRNVARHALDLIEPGMTIGLGTGSTVEWLIKELAERVAQGFVLTVVPTSLKTAELVRKIGISVVDLNDVDALLLTIDGADEIDPFGQLIKGGGGALLQEKIVAAASQELIIIADYTKHVTQLGQFPLPVEVIPFGYKNVAKRILASGECKSCILREKADAPFITDHGHYILDCNYERISNPMELDLFLHNIPGVVETGLFIHLATRALIGFPDGRVEERKFR
ncbi:MAG: ribose-5-phosphate isomerase RpiA [Chitinophagaceae bacterium]|nr:ribose-5-phosphate isomerase RpiA [Chitinophagaceae bacterium]